MRLLFDQNLSFKLCGQLEDLFPGSIQVAQIGMATANDIEIWDYAKANGFVVVSLDSDFADLAAHFGPPPKVIWLRLGNMPTAVVERTLRAHVVALTAFEADGASACLEIY